MASLSTKTPGRLITHLLCRVGELTNRTLVLPLPIYFPTSRCNSRCISCDWWRSSGADDLSVDEVARVADELPGSGSYFQRPAANVREAPLHRIVRQDLPRFRATLRVEDDPVRQRCVCSGKIGHRSRLC